MSHYVGGLAAECVFRAFKCRMDTELDERHDLRLLSRRFIEKVPNRLLTKVAAAVGELVNRWDNAHRFRSEDAVRRFLTGRKLFARRGDLLEDSSRKIVSAALLIVGVGKNLWNR